MGIADCQIGSRASTCGGLASGNYDGRPDDYRHGHDEHHDEYHYKYHDEHHDKYHHEHHVAAYHDEHHVAAAIIAAKLADTPQLFIPDQRDGFMRTPMSTVTLALHGQRVGVLVPPSLTGYLERLFPLSMMISAPAESHVTVQEHGSHYSLYTDHSPPALGLPLSEILVRLMEEVTKALITRLDAGVALHAAAVGYKGLGILMPGPTGSGKSSLAAWLLAGGFDLSHRRDRDPERRRHYPWVPAGTRHQAGGGGKRPGLGGLR